MLLGPLIPELRDAWGVGRPELAMLFPAQFFASSVGSVLSSFRPKWSLVAGYGCMATGLLLVAWLPWPAPLAGFLVVGFGLGLVASATNLRVARAAHPDREQAGKHAGEHSGRRGADLSLLNMIWGLGAVSCPLLFAGVAGRLPAQWLLPAAGVVIAVPALFLTRLPPATQRLAAAPSGKPRTVDRPPSAATTALRLLPLAGLFFFYVGIEATVGGWLVAYAESVAKGVIPLLIGSGFWAALLLGRGLSPWVLRRVSEPRLFLAALSTSLAGALCLRFAASEWWIAVAALVMGFGLAPVFPLTVSFLAGQTEAAGGRQAGWVFAFAGLGGATLPWLTGRLPAADATLARGFIVPVVALILMFGLFGLQRRIAGRAGSHEPC